MHRSSLKDMVGGWFIGNFNPSVVKSEMFEVTVRKYAKGEREPKHHQLIATEVTVIVDGKARICLLYTSDAADE